MSEEWKQMWPIREKLTYYQKKNVLGFSGGSGVMNLTRIHEDVGLIPGVKDPALP